MRQFTQIVIVILAVISCSKKGPQFDSDQNGDNSGIPFSAVVSIGQESKALYESGNTLFATWEVGDKIALIHNGISDEMTVTSTGGGNATISGTITGNPSNGEAITLIYPSSAADAATGKVKAHFFEFQKGVLSGTNGSSLSEKYDVRKSNGATLRVVGGNASLNGSVALNNVSSIFKFTLKNEDGTAPIDVKSLIIIFRGDYYSIVPDTPTSELYVALPETSALTIQFYADSGDYVYTYSRSHVNFSAGYYFQSTLRMAPIPKGLITVSDTQKVLFSRGNLQYRASTGKWRFAENQYDVIGSGNEHVSPGYSGWIDLFGWATSGAPYMTSTTETDYGPAISSGDFSQAWDWGSNLIEDDPPGTWRTLSSSEWGNVVYSSRSIMNSLSKGKLNYNGSYHHAIIGGSQNGIILFPDYYIHPSEVVFDPAYGVNPLSYEDWALMEEAGCVFLPASGNRLGTEVSNVNAFGKYWSRTAGSTTRSYLLYFGSDSGAGVGLPWARYLGCSVRLVHDYDLPIGNNEPLSSTTGEWSDSFPF